MEGKGVRRHNINNLWIVLLLPSGSFWVISLALSHASKRQHNNLVSIWNGYLIGGSESHFARKI
jgi:hypothetical protein